MKSSPLFYEAYIPKSLRDHLLLKAKPVNGVNGLVDVGPGGGLESTASFRFLVDLYLKVKQPLEKVLNQRVEDRTFIDTRVKAFYQFNKEHGISIDQKTYQTILGLEDADGRVVFGPLGALYCKPGGKKIKPIPKFLEGPHVTLFGPPDSAKMSINAMNAYHRKLAGEPKIVEQLLSSNITHPTWGADDEDSKTPLRIDLQEAAKNLTACLDGSINISSGTEDGSEKYKLARDFLSHPIKRFPGLALPCSFLFYENCPIPLHLYDFALHLFVNYKNPKALVFYVPKLENEEEARYIKILMDTAERMIQAFDTSYQIGTIRLMIVLENPRAILRTHEIIDELDPYFMGASLGWHDYLGSTARLFKEDGNYRIPVKADPNIVIKYIKASHSLLADVVGSRGGVKVGGMYGLLPRDNDIKSPSFQITLRGYFKDVITQLKRHLTGFWVAHPDFVRLGLAIVESWKQYQSGQKESLRVLISEIFLPDYQSELLKFIDSPDIEGLNKNDPNYVRKLIVADIKESDFIPNHHPDEIRYNVFQSLQYLTDWLSGNGCVALPTIVDGIPVRVMDDLATAERSRWEVWHEIRHQRFSLAEFIKIAHEEMRFIRKDLSNATKIVQIKWNEQTEKWYPVAFKLMLKLMTDPHPPEFATELLMPFTVSEIRDAKNPWDQATKIAADHFKLDSKVDRLNHYFETCGSLFFSQSMADRRFQDIGLAKKLIFDFTLDQVNEAASFHGDIGETKSTLDHTARQEQSLAQSGRNDVLHQLQKLGKEYKEKFGFKFLISAAGKSADDLLQALQNRLNNTYEQEFLAAKNALWEITLKRLSIAPKDQTPSLLENIFKRHDCMGLQVAVVGSNQGPIQTFCFGESKPGVAIQQTTLFQIASLSKTIASALAMEIFRDHKISINEKVVDVLKRCGSTFKLSVDNTKSTSPSNESSVCNQLTLRDLLSHTGLNMHYVNGFSPDQPLPTSDQLLSNPEAYGYEAIKVNINPGKEFRYSGGGFIVLEHLLEKLTGKSSADLSKQFLDHKRLKHLFLSPNAGNFIARDIALNHPFLNFPSCAAGGWSNAESMLGFLQSIGAAYQDLDSINTFGDSILGHNENSLDPPNNVPRIVSHDTARHMLASNDLGSVDFMGARMGLGVFVLDAGENRVMVHQGANDGFRALYIYAFHGPDAGKGFVILSNSDNKAVLLISEIAQSLLKGLEFSGIDFAKYESLHSARMNLNSVSQENIVNQGYKEWIFDAFEPMLPEKIVPSSKMRPLVKKDLLQNASILGCNDQKFARAENLISPFEPCFDPTLFGKQGKIMDSWETVRHNPQGLDWLHLEMKAPSSIRYIYLSTKFHDGNHTPGIRLLGCNVNEQKWTEFLPKTSIDAHSEMWIDLGSSTQAFQKIRVEGIPDGGITRLGLYETLSRDEAAMFQPRDNAKSKRCEDLIPKTKKPLTIPTTNRDKQKLGLLGKSLNYASSLWGASILRASNEHYSPASQVISPYPPLHMFDGLESSRSRIPGHFEEVEIKLCESISIGRILFDFTFFVNNNDTWMEICPKSLSKPYAGNKQEFLFQNLPKTDVIRVRTYPDGGINRIQVFAHI
ncbi:MAG: serine hydrolase [Proteobacteria bacterium]|nr:serine hydrolase [Pseudomonadota bacterium]